MPEREEHDSQGSAQQEARVNQHRDEPMPASHHAGDDQPASGRTDGHSADRPAEPAEPGQAVRDMMGGPPPQGDVPDAPATQIAATGNEEGQDPGVTRVANAVPGKPDGEVDTRA